jgi:nitroreductase
MTLNLTADEVLTTTRSVRKRLDFDRPVPREVLMECLEIALQAPTGSNSQGWQWMFVEDPAKKQALAEIYRAAATPYLDLPKPERGDIRDQQMDAVVNSAKYLNDNMEKAPVLLIPLLEGRPDNAPIAMQASYWGSILPAVWSFMLAARARGLGSVWTTMTCRREEEVAAVVGVDPTQYSHAGLFPLAYTIGTDFKPAPRLPMDTVVHWNRW